MIISATIRHCKSCYSINLDKDKDVEEKPGKLNMKVLATCKDCGYQAKYPHISNDTVKNIKS